MVGRKCPHFTLDHFGSLWGGWASRCTLTNEVFVGGGVVLDWWRCGVAGGGGGGGVFSFNLTLKRECLTNGSFSSRRNPEHFLCPSKSRSCSWCVPQSLRCLQLLQSTQHQAWLFYTNSSSRSLSPTHIAHFFRISYLIRPVPQRLLDRLPTAGSALTKSGIGDLITRQGERQEV